MNKNETQIIGIAPVSRVEDVVPAPEITEDVFPSLEIPQDVVPTPEKKDDLQWTVAPDWDLPSTSTIEEPPKRKSTITPGLSLYQRKAEVLGGIESRLNTVVYGPRGLQREIQTNGPNSGTASRAFRKLDDALKLIREATEILEPLA